MNSRLHLKMTTCMCCYWRPTQAKATSLHLNTSVKIPLEEHTAQTFNYLQQHFTFKTSASSPISWRKWTLYLWYKGKRILEVFLWLVSTCAYGHCVLKFIKYIVPIFLHEYTFAVCIFADITIKMNTRWWGNFNHHVVWHAQSVS